MKKWIWIIMILPFLTTIPKESPANYLIKLNNGGSFITNSYWEEGNTINFFSGGGIVGISKNQISTITDSESPVPKELKQVEPLKGDSAKNYQEIETSDEGDINKESENLGFKEKEQQLRTTYFKIKAERDDQTHFFNTAKEQKDQAAQDIAWKQLKQLNVQQNQLEQEVQELFNGSLPEWWD
jgi:multidrug efflux pump subunit AcrB